MYRFFGSWPRAREALDLSETPRNTPRRIEARFRERRLGKTRRYDDDDLRVTLARAVEHYGYPPSTAEFDCWREREFELARATGREEPHLPSVTPYPKGPRPHNCGSEVLESRSAGGPVDENDLSC